MCNQCASIFQKHLAIYSIRRRMSFVSTNDYTYLRWKRAKLKLKMDDYKGIVILDCGGNLNIVIEGCQIATQY